MVERPPQFSGSKREPSLGEVSPRPSPSGKEREKRATTRCLSRWRPVWMRVIWFGQGGELGFAAALELVFELVVFGAGFGVEPFPVERQPVGVWHAR